ncbi:T9SS type A sorting domain-containing protein [Flavobacterium sp. Sd200]|uniref:M12 family metallo-peptidase n=1 Tax=Flavobacterium sp. Sd200 TaxID=2692211 RepID=UPI0013686FE6|nr:M12 family metallo-peptidase [Flavobacterium sp. Sd200]MXN92662.1 T9SS type A sorting domain-containing protein [Flavobacterium sp. Sd200]
MKKITLLIALLSAMSFYGQQKIAARVNELTEAKTPFKRVEPLTVSNTIDSKAASVVNNATFATLNERVLQNIVANKYPYIELGIPYDGNTINVLLYRVEITTNDFHVDTDKQLNAAQVKGVFYRGIINGDTNSLASFNFFNSEMNGIISSAELNNLVVGKLQKAGNVSDYIVYSDAQLTVPFDFSCGISDGDELPDNHARMPQDALSERCVTLYFELDYDAYIANNSSVENATNWITSIFNNSQTLFANDGITTALRSVFVWTEEDGYTGSSSSDYLEAFIVRRPVFDADVAQFITTNGGGLGGVAGGIGSICTARNMSFSDVNMSFSSVPSYSWTVQVITHELGHVFGSPHTHGCYWNGNNTSIDGCGTTAGFVEGNCAVGPIPTSGTIMSYCHLVSAGINFTNGFGPQPLARILAHINASRCLGTDCITTCINTVTSVAVSSTLTSVTLTWEDTGNGPWQVANTSVNGTPINYRRVDTNSITIENLTPNTYYRFGIRPLCDTGMQGEALVFNAATSADWCSGAVFYDTGGASENYRDSQRVIRTLKPENANEVYTVTFNTFNTESGFDILSVYNGPNTSSPLIGSYSGTEIPGPFTSTAADRSLTFEFISDQGTVREGWSATVTCSTAGLKDSTFANLEYYPNPTNNNVTVSSTEGITGITVYNLAGQLLMDKKVSGTTADANIASFANGIYLFKVTNGTKTAHFRIVKQ